MFEKNYATHQLFWGSFRHSLTSLQRHSFHYDADKFQSKPNNLGLQHVHCLASSPWPLQRICPGALFTSTKETVARDQRPLGRLRQQDQALWPMASLTSIDHCVIGHFLNTLTPTVPRLLHLDWTKRWTVDNFALSVLLVFVCLLMTWCETAIYTLSTRSYNTPDEVSLQ